MPSRKPPVSATELKRAYALMWGSVAGWFLVFLTIMAMRESGLGPELFLLAVIPFVFGAGSLAMSGGALGHGITFIAKRSNGRDAGWLLTIVGGVPVACFLLWMWSARLGP